MANTWVHSLVGLLMVCHQGTVQFAFSKEGSAKEVGGNYDLYAVRKERDKAWSVARQTSKMQGTVTGNKAAATGRAALRGGLSSSSEFSNTKDAAQCCECPNLDKPLMIEIEDQVVSTAGSIRAWALYYFWFGAKPSSPSSRQRKHSTETDQKKSSSSLRGYGPASSRQQCCECPAGTRAASPPQQPAAELQSMETMLHDALMVRLLFRAWGRLPPLGSDATSERALVGAQAAGKYLSSPNFARESWLGWVEALHRLGATNLLKELKAFRAIKAPRKEEADVYGTIDTLWRDVMAQGGMTQEDVDETASMGLSSQDAQRLEAVSTACKGAVPDEEDETWCMDALPFKARPSEHYERCALVGNSQRLLLSEHGAAIDAHDAVVRLNDAATFHHMQAFAGSRTTLRVLSKEGVKKYLDDFNGELQLEPNVTVVALTADYTDFFQLAHAVRARNPLAETKKLDPRFVRRAEELLEALRTKIETFLGVQYSGPTTPSTGFLGLVLLLQMCNKVDVYGMQLGDIVARWDPHNQFRATSSSYHYYEENGILFNAQPLNELEHSWELEHDVLQILEGAGHVRHHLPPIRNPATEEEVLQQAIDKVSEANCIRHPGHMWSPFRHMCISE